MIKIGILTFHKSINYGSVLQAYALSKLLQEKGFSVEVIDYEPASYKSQYRIFEKINSIHNVAANVRRMTIVDILLKQKNGFEEFRKRNLPLSKEKYSIASSADAFADHYDVVICGSDQIWNVTAKDCDPIYFLPGTQPYKKIAYAASINTATYKEQMCGASLKQNIIDFHYISIREHTGAQKLAEFLQFDMGIKVQPDPSLLQTKEVFSSLASECIVKKPYIFMYCANYQKSTIQAAQKISALLNKPVYTIVVCRSASQIVELKKAGIRIVRNRNSPEDFLSYIKNADLVLSNSFHGTAFSIIFEKKFFSINDYINGKYVDDERICNILGELGLMDRYVKENDIFSLDFRNEIDYSIITEKRMCLAKKAIKELLEAIET